MEGAIAVQDSPKILSRFCWIRFNTEQLNKKHEEIVACSNKAEFSFICVHFQLFVDIHDWTEAKHDCKPFSAAAETPDERGGGTAGYY